MIDHALEVATRVGDVVSVSVVVATLAQFLPAIAASLSIMWSIIRIYETKTVQKWLGNFPTE